MRIATHYEKIVYDDIARNGSHSWVTRHVDASPNGLIEVTEHGSYDGRTDISVRNVTEKAIGVRQARRLIMNGCGAPTSALNRLDQWDADRRAGRIKADEIGG
jgi:hypothetical protein